MPPFGTCFQSKVGPGYALQAATHGIAKAGYLTEQVHCGLARIALARADARPRLPLFRSAWDFMAEMEATMTWKALPSGRYLLAPGRARLRVRPTSFEFSRSAPGARRRLAVGDSHEEDCPPRARTAVRIASG